MNITAPNVILSVVTKNAKRRLFLQKTNNMTYIPIIYIPIEMPQQPKHEHSFFTYEDETIISEDIITHREIITRRLKSIICLCGEVLEVTPQIKQDRVVENNITHTKLN